MIIVRYIDEIHGKVPEYDVVCVECGLLHGDIPSRSGLAAATEAINDGWSWRYGDFYCPDEMVPRWEPERVNPSYWPEDAKGTSWRCGNCGRKTIKRGRPIGHVCTKCNEPFRFKERIM